MARIYQDNADTLSIAEGLANAHSLRLGDSLVITESTAFDWVAVRTLDLSDAITIADARKMKPEAILTDAQVITETLIDEEFTEEVWWVEIKNACVHAGI